MRDRPHDLVGGILHEQGRRAGWLAGKMGITLKRLNRVRLGQYPWRAEEVQAAEKALGVAELGRALREAGYAILGPERSRRRRASPGEPPGGGE